MHDLRAMVIDSNHLARAHGMGAIVEQVNVDRSALYRSLSGEMDPAFVRFVSGKVDAIVSKHRGPSSDWPGPSAALRIFRVLSGWVMQNINCELCRRLRRADNRIAELDASMTQIPVRHVG
jgi:hypothetical protein